MYENHLKYDDMLPFIFDVAKNIMGYKNFEKTYKKIFTFLLKKFKDEEECVKFLALDGSSEEIPLHAIVIVSGEIEKLNNPNQQQEIPRGQGTNVDFEPFFSEKTLLFPTISDKLKIIAINKNFDRIFRENFYDLVDRMYAIEADKETYMNGVNEEYEKFVSAMLIKLTEFYQKEALELVVALPKEGGEEEEKEDKEEGDDAEKAE